MRDAKRRLVLGFDVGGTKTAAILIDGAGHVLGRGFGGSGNTNFIPLEIANKSFADAIAATRKMAGLKTLDAECVVVGTEPDPKPVAAVIGRLAGTSRILHRKEGECSMVGGLVSKTGLSLICGTGSVGWGRNAKGQTSMTSCWGPIGDEGSAYDLARRGVNAAFWAWDGRGRKTILVDMLLTMFKQKDMRAVCTPLYTSPNLRKDFASLAKLVTEAADKGDRVALEVLTEGARQVALFLSTCASNLKMGAQGYKVAAPVSGLVTGSNGRYFKMINRELRKIHPKARLVKPRFEPVVGAGLIALDAIGIAWTPELVRNLENSLRRLR
jgi:N-acetylglucosamine kinase-like BadF-type ATPase